jgi:CheY-like chemotaxis protein
MDHFQLSQACVLSFFDYNDVMKKTYTALVVDDEPEIVEILSDFLSSFLCIKIFKASSGQEAIFEINNECRQFDFILSDIKMKNGSGLDLYLFNLNNKNIPFIFISASAENIPLGVTFVEKPFELKALKAKISLILEQKMNNKSDGL